MIAKLFRSIFSPGRPSVTPGDQNASIHREAHRQQMPKLSKPDEEMQEFFQRQFEQAKLERAVQQLNLAQKLSDPDLKRHYDAQEPRIRKILENCSEKLGKQIEVDLDTDRLIEFINSTRSTQAAWNSEQRRAFYDELHDKSKTRKAHWQLSIDRMLRDPLLKAAFDANDAPYRKRHTEIAAECGYLIDLQ